MRVLFCLFLTSALLFSGLFLVNEVHATDITSSGLDNTLAFQEVANASSKPTPSTKPPQTYSTKNFWIQSNSTITALSFNNKTLELSLTVFGENGTVGYVKVRILKSMLPDPELVKVTIDGHKADYALKSNPDNWFMEISYPHSEHQIKVTLAMDASDNFLGIPRLVWISSIVTAIFGLTVVVYVVMWLAKRKLPTQAS